MVCDDYVKYEKTELDRSAIMAVFLDNEKQEAEVQCHPPHNLGSEFWRPQIIKKVYLRRPF